MISAKLENSPSLFRAVELLAEISGSAAARIPSGDSRALLVVLCIKGVGFLSFVSSVALY